MKPIQEQLVRIISALRQFRKPILLAGFIMFAGIAILVFYRRHFKARNNPTPVNTPASSSILPLPENEAPQARIPVTSVVTIAGLFRFVDEIVRQNDTMSQYKLTENLLIRANPWILDTLVHTDYYYQMAIGNFIYNQSTLVVLKPGDTLLIPGPKTGAVLQEKISRTHIDVNIPAFELRIMEADSVLFVMPVRVGKKQKKYLELAEGWVDLRTRTGAGEIFRVNRDPLFLDPVTGKKFKFTKRDDHQITWMPRIPWLEPTINGIRYGQMIHPTTNPKTLGKPASNGCIGVGEADGWRVYVYAPVGTKVLIRYDLESINELGDTLHYPDIYQLRRSVHQDKPIAVAGFLKAKTAGICQCDTMF